MDFGISVYDKIEVTEHGRTKKPCPKCGKLDPYRPADLYCRDCQHRMFENEAIRKRYKAILKRAEDNPAFYVPEGRVYLKGFFHLNESGFTGTNRDTIEKGLAYLINRLSTPCLADRTEEYERRRKAGHRDQYDQLVATVSDLCHHRPKTVRMHHEDAECLAELAEAISNALILAYEGGAQRGSSAIMNLASGEITMDDFNKATTSHLKR